MSVNGFDVNAQVSELGFFEHCQARRCARPTRPGRAFCDRHWAMLPEAIVAAIDGVDPRMVFFATASRGNLRRIEALAEAIEVLARREGHLAANLYRMRARRWAEKLAEEGTQEARGDVEGRSGEDFTAETAEGAERGKRGES